MKRSLKELQDYSLKAIDGEKGKVKNFLFDDESWIVRYLEADLGGIFSRKRVLIPREYLGEPNWDDKHFPVELTIENIKNAPDIDFDLPVSRKYEKELVSHYELRPYWPASIAPYSGRESILYPASLFKVPKDIGNEDEKNTHLRSFKEISGYFIKAVDGNFGHVEDLIIDDTDWQILYVVVDTSNIVPWSKVVMLPIEWIDEISFINQKAIINLPKDTIKSAPEYNPAMAINAEYERVLYDFYGRKIIK
jgi:hypothetical protein